MPSTTKHFYIRMNKMFFPNGNVHHMDECISQHKVYRDYFIVHAYDKAWLDCRFARSSQL